MLGFTRDAGELLIQLGTGEVYRWDPEAVAAGEVAPVFMPEPEFNLKLMGTLTAAARRTRVEGGQTTAMSSDGALFATTIGREVRFTDPAGTVLRTFTPSDRSVRAVAFSPDGATIAVGSDDTRIHLLDVATGAVRRTLTGHRDLIYTLAFSPDGTRLASGGNDNAVIIWDPENGDPLLELRRHAAYVHAVSFSPDGASLVTASGDGTVRIWRTSN